MSLESDIKILSSLHIFSFMEPEALKLIVFAAETQTLRAGDVLFKEGDASDGGYVVISGAVVLDSTRSKGVAEVVLGSGALLGESALLIATNRTVTAITRQNATLLKIPRALFRRALQEFPVTAQRLKTALTMELQIYTKELLQTRNNILS